MPRRPTPEPAGALYVKLPADTVDRLHRAAEALGIHKKDLVAGLIDKHVDPDSAPGLQALDALSPRPRPQLGASPTTSVHASAAASPRRFTNDLAGGTPAFGWHSFQPYDAEPPPEVMTVEQAAELLQVEASTLLELAEAGELPGRKLGSTWRFSRAAIIAWLGAAPR